ncbi:unnamed protein product, partial [Candidula unifasciata]
MEGSAANSMSSDLRAGSAQLATVGKSPQDWKAYIDSVKLKVQSWDAHRRNRMISYLYVSAFKVIPNTDTSFSYAQLLVDYAEFTSYHDLNEAVRMLAFARKILPRYSIIHIASAETELKKGQREEAVSILQKAILLETEPVSEVLRALERLNEGKAELRDHTKDERTQDDTHSGILLDISNRQCEAGLSALKHVKPDTLTLMSSASRQNLNFPVLAQNTSESSGIFSTPSCELPKVVDKIIIDGRCQKSDSTQRNDSAERSHSSQQSHSSQPSHSSQRSDVPSIVIAEPPPHQGPTRKLQLPSSDKTRLTAEISGPITQQSNGTWPVYSNTPLNLRSGDHLKARADTTRDFLVKPQEVQRQSGISDRTFSMPDYMSAVNSAITPAKSLIMPSNCFMGDSATPCSGLDLGSKRGNQNGGKDSSGEFSSSQSATLSFRKFRPLNLGPPRRVKVDPALKKLSDDEDEAFQSQEMTFSDPESHSQPATASEKTDSGFPLDRSCQKSGTKSFPAAKSDTLTHFLPARAGTSGFPFVLHNKYETNSMSAHPSYEAPKVADKTTIGDTILRNEISAVLRVRPAPCPGSSRKLQLQSSDSANQLTAELSAPMAQLSDDAHPVCSRTSVSDQPDDHQKGESTKEILIKQQEIIQQLLQQQQQQQQQQQSVVNNKTFSVHESQSGIAPAKSLTQSEHKTIVVNGKPYTVMNLVGRGGSAKVYRVYDPATNTILAVKCVNLACANQVIVEGYKNEINLLKKLQQCGRVIKLYDYEYVEARKKLFVVLEYGETDLCKFISQSEKNPTCLHPINIRYFWLQMVSAVHAMHQEGVIHSDLKPANFILVSGEVKLIDFGIANSLQQDSTSVLKDNMVGTPSYMSPEALMSVSPYTDGSKPTYKVGVRSDVWSLGCILYQMVYGHTPFQHVRQKLEAIVNPAHEIPFPDKGDPKLMDILK